MTLSQLRYAITVADSRSMNQAAQKLFISQPSLSAAIRELEDEVGIEIFRRTNRGIQVTPDGEEFVGYARQVVEQYALIEARYVDKEKVKKKFGVSMQHYSFAVQAFVEMVRRFGMERYEFSIYETQTYDVIENVKNFRSELGILYLNDFNRKYWGRSLRKTIWNFMSFLTVRNTFTCGAVIRWQKRRRLLWKIWKIIHFFRLTRGATIRFILRRKCSVRMNTNSRSRRMTVRRC